MKKKCYLGIDTNEEEVFAIVGKVTVGKTLMASRLLKKNFCSGNYPGTTVELNGGQMGPSNRYIIDTPGNYTIWPENEDEMITRSLFFDGLAKKIIFMADAKNLHSSLALFYFFREFELPIIVNINMMDEAWVRGVYIDVNKLKGILGVEVNTSVAIEGAGVDDLKKIIMEEKIESAAKDKYPPEVEKYFREVFKLVPRTLKFKRVLSLLLLMNDKLALDHIKKHLDVKITKEVIKVVKKTQRVLPKNLYNYFSKIYLNWAQETVAQVVNKSSLVRIPFSEKLGIWSRNIWTGIPIAILVLVAMYLFVGELGATLLVGLLEGKLFGEILIPLLERALAPLNSKFISDLFVGDFGLFSIGITLALGIVFPVLLTFYFFFGMLESSGYWSRLAILFDRMFKKIGMSGQGIIPIIMGFSCITMALLTTRVLKTEKEKLIATFLLIRGIPCAPLFGVMFICLGKMSFWAYIILFGIIFFQSFLSGYLLNKLLPGGSPDFLFEVTPMRIPYFRGLISNTFRRTYNFLKEALPIFLLATLIIFFLEKIGGITFLENFLGPILTRFVGLPKESLSVFIMSMIRREAGVAMLTQFASKNLFTNVQILVNLLVVTSLIPCMNAILVIIKERGLKVAILMAFFTIPYAIILGALVNFLLLYFSVKL